MKKILLCITILLVSQIAFADVVYFKNGRSYDGEVKVTEEGVWVEGLFFEQDEIDRIEKYPTKKKSYQDSNQKKALKAYKKRRRKTSEAMKDLKAKTPKKKKKSKALPKKYQKKKVQKKQTKGSPTYKGSRKGSGY